MPLTQVNMAINFCSHEFGTIVTTNSVSADGYEVENLLGKTKTMWGQPKGFVAESFIKPPVDINLMFGFNIWIQKIVIDPKVGGQMSGGVDVFTASGPLLRRGSGHQCKDGKKILDCLDKPNLKSQSEMQSEKDIAVFSSVGRSFSTDRNTTTFCFVNLSYQSIYPQITGNLLPDDSLPGEVKKSLRYSQPGALTNVSHVTLRINRVISGSVAVKSVQVWGQPSRNCSKEIITWVLQVANLVQNPHKNEQKDQQVAKQTDKVKSVETCRHDAKKTKNALDEQECPEEFIDPITNEMLMLPVLLPSGHTVDSETLTKHSKAEAVWGRLPNDPFTGILFSQGSKPLPNVKLKERIDQYLLKAGRNVSLAVPRDVGRSRDRGTNQVVPTPASLVSHPRSVSAPNIKQNVKTSRGSNLDITDLNSVKTGPCSENSVFSASSKRKRPLDYSSHTFMNKRRPSTSTRNEEDVGDINKPSCSSSVQAPSICHEDMLSESLDTALEQALSAVPSFSRKRTQQCSNVIDDGAINSWSCSACHKTIATKDGYHVNGPLNMYKLPCTHLICRSCLLSRHQNTSGKCSSCDRTFKPSEVVKVHL